MKIRYILSGLRCSKVTIQHGSYRISGIWCQPCCIECEASSSRGGCEDKATVNGNINFNLMVMNRRRVFLKRDVTIIHF